MLCKKNILCSLLLVISVTLAAQQPFHYQAAWKNIDTLIQKKGLTESALKEVARVYDHAKKSNNQPELIKALLYRMNLQRQKDENASINSIIELEKEIAAAKGGARAILQSITAEQYLVYFRQHRYQLYDRTTIKGKKDKDIATWSSEDLHEKISSLYTASVEQENILQQTRISAFDTIIVKGNARNLRPTLFDLLAFRALDYFTSDERTLTKPAYAFIINDPAAFAPAKEFSAHLFASADTSSLYYKAIELYRHLLSFHLGDKTPDALIDADIQRLEFVNGKAVMEAKDSLYRKALTEITGKFPDLPVAAQAWYLLAETYAANARHYDPLTDTSNRFDFIPARNICERILQQPTNSEGRTNCANLLRQIDMATLNVQLETVNIPGKPFRILLSYKNFDCLHYRIVKADRKIKEMLGNNSWEDTYWKKFLQLPVFRSASQLLPGTADFQQHSVELKIDSLPVGQYALITGTADSFSLQPRKPLGVAFFSVSGISCVNNDNDYFVLDRSSGHPLPQASVQIWNRKYDYNTRRNILEKAEAYLTDENGYFRMKDADPSRYNNQQLEIRYKQDHFFEEEQMRIYRYYGNDDENKYAATEADIYEKNHRRTFLFTDRSIYRPGQTVYFKGITLTRVFRSSQHKPVEGVRSKILLRDANSQVTDSVELTTNDFGSYSGKFTLPEGVLNGSFSISDENSKDEISFAVEEYKRPRFYVEYEKPQGSYKVGDTIAVQGLAKGYAGNNITGGKVSYRVYRRARFPYPWLYIGKRYPVSGNQEIANGETGTSSNGSFAIRFNAIPDPSVDKKLKPVFDYIVAADVTDINGETRSAETTISAGYQGIVLSVTMPFTGAIPADSLRYISISTENLSDVFQPSPVTATIYRLKAPDRLIRARFWAAPDQFAMEKDEFLSDFPHDEYYRESKAENWPVAEPVFQKEDTTKQGYKLDLSSVHLPAGHYLIDVKVKDSGWELLESKIYIELLDRRTGIPASPQYSWGENTPDENHPGETASASVGSSANDIFVISTIERANNKDSTKDYDFIQLSNEKKNIDWKVTEMDRGGFAISTVFVKDNRVYPSTKQINVPWDNKELEIKYETFRDKTEPGSKERWAIHIRGKGSDSVAAEVLTSMYDASLDQFARQQWAVPSIYPYYFPGSSWGTRNFGSVSSNERNNLPEMETFLKTYDHIAYLDNRFPGIESRALRKPVPGIAIKEMPQAQDMKLSEVSVVGYGTKKNSDSAEMLAANAEAPTPIKQLQVRRDFNETAFFFPDLRTDSSGSLSFSFTMPDAVTRWKWMTLAHTKDMSFAYSEKEIVTQKQLMVQPNPPRFLREGDRMDFSGKIVNLSDKELTGQVQLELIDPETNKSVDGWFRNMFPNQYFTVAAGESFPVSFTIEIPFRYNRPVNFRMIARTDSLSDGEEAALPVLSNRLLVTESKLLQVTGNSAKNFKFEKLLQSGSSETLSQYALTVEFSSNPAWYAVQALPYLKEGKCECADQLFNRYYANALATRIANISPKLREIFDKWKDDTTALFSNLQKNQELKTILLEETPWVLEAKTEAEQKKNLAILFNTARMAEDLQAAIQKLALLQSPNGGFVWMPGGPEDRYMTQYIISGIGHLLRLKAIPKNTSAQVLEMARKGLKYLDSRLTEDYESMIKNKKEKTPGYINNIQVQYIYTRSLFAEEAVPGTVFRAYNYYRKLAQQQWLKHSRYMQGMIALALFRTGDIQTARNIIASLKENAIVNDEIGMYWKDMNVGYYWYQAPVETEALLIEAFSEITKDVASVNKMKTWLLKNKQTNNWKSSRATAEACYALLLSGSDWLTNEPEVEINLGDTKISPDHTEAGTGYFKKVISGSEVKPEMGDIQVFVKPEKQSGEQPAWGAIYWQYFENIDRITPAATPLSIRKELFTEKNTDRGPQLQPLKDLSTLAVGDKVTVRIELRADRDLEYVQLKDMRAAAFEPVNAISEYKWQNGIGYYETTRDASTSFFFNSLPKGTYVFEYSLFATHTGNFSNGVSTVQCMYAPEFSSHSEGIRVTIEHP